jgi:protocatechuate 3,4-dioxygenase beta subunit
MNRSRTDRRVFLGTMAASAAFFATHGLFAEQLALAPTPAREEGPFYPDKLPLDVDNDLIIINDQVTPAVGEITHLTGRVLDASGSPIRGATVEIWQADSNGIYFHTAHINANPDRHDRNFQGYGRFETDSTGGYRFRTIKPVAYQGRPAPHIHFRVKKGERELLTTQLIIAGHPGNNLDPIATGGLTLFERELLQADFTPVKGSKIGELAASFEIVLGRTPDERSFRPRATSTTPLS